MLTLRLVPLAFAVLVALTTFPPSHASANDASRTAASTLPEKVAARSVFPLTGPQCVVVLPPGMQLDPLPASGNTVEIASADPEQAIIDPTPADESAGNAADVADAEPAPGPGVVPPDVLGFALRAHALYPVVPISVTLAQWAKESAWNSAMPPNSNNPFGIKCYDPVKGCSAAKTPEQDAKGRQRIVSQSFQTFPSMDDAFADHARILATLPFYETARDASDIDGFARGLKAYATDKDYTASLIRDYLKPYDLYKYDDCEGALLGS